MENAKTAKRPGRAQTGGGEVRPVAVGWQSPSFVIVIPEGVIVASMSSGGEDRPWSCSGGGGERRPRSLAMTLVVTPGFTSAFSWLASCAAWSMRPGCWAAQQWPARVPRPGGPGARWPQAIKFAADYAQRSSDLVQARTVA